jgi:hypothetical protein
MLKRNEANRNTTRKNKKQRLGSVEEKKFIGGLNQQKHLPMEEDRVSTEVHGQLIKKLKRLSRNLILLCFLLKEVVGFSRYYVIVVILKKNDEKTTHKTKFKIKILDPNSAEKKEPTDKKEPMKTQKGSVKFTENNKKTHTHEIKTIEQNLKNKENNKILKQNKIYKNDPIKFVTEIEKSSKTDKKVTKQKKNAKKAPKKITKLTNDGKETIEVPELSEDENESEDAEINFNLKCRVEKPKTQNKNNDPGNRKNFISP